MFSAMVLPFLQPIRILSLYKVLDYGGSRKGVIVYNIDFGGFIQDISTLRSEQDFGLSLRTGMARWWKIFGEKRPMNKYSPLRRAHPAIIGGTEIALYIAPCAIYRFIFILHSFLSGIQSAMHEQMGAVAWIIAGGFLLVLVLTIIISIHIYHPFKKILAALNTPAGLMSDRVSISRDEGSFYFGLHSWDVPAKQAYFRGTVSTCGSAQTGAIRCAAKPNQSAFPAQYTGQYQLMTMRLTGGKNEASVMLAKLAQILRYSLDDVDTLVPLRRELENTRIYLELQAMRYKKQFSCGMGYPRGCAGQAGYQNHAAANRRKFHPARIKTKRPGGIIRISAAERGESLEICIRDNGVGIQPERMQTIQAALHSDMIKQRESIGIVNVHQRIQLFTANNTA